MWLICSSQENVILKVLWFSVVVVQLVTKLLIVQEWCKRWFVLTTDELACYRDSRDELTNDVESAVLIVPDTVVSGHDAGHGYAFHVTVRLSSFSASILIGLIVDCLLSVLMNRCCLASLVL